MAVILTGVLGTGKTTVMERALEKKKIERRRARDKGIRSADGCKRQYIVAMDHAILTGATVKIVKNNDGMLGETSNEIIKVLG